MSLPTMSSKLPADAPVPRLCHLVKWADFDGYGFNLHAEKSRTGQFIGKVDDQSPAQTAGLREGDRIIEVNGVNIANENHRQVVERIKSIPNETKLLVVDEEADGWYKERKIVVKSTQANVSSKKTPVPRPAQDPPLYVNVAPTLAENGVKKSANGVAHDPEEHIEKHEGKLNGSATPRGNGGPIEEKTIEHEIEIEREIEREIVREVVREPSPKIIRGKPLDSPKHKTKDEGSSSRSSTPMDGGSTGSAPDSSHSNESNTNGGLYLNNVPDSSHSAESNTNGGLYLNNVPDSPQSTESNTSLAFNGGLNLNMSASEMRQMLAARRKKDPKKDQMDIRQKYEIIQQM